MQQQQHDNPLSSEGVGKAAGKAGGKAAGKGAGEAAADRNSSMADMLIAWKD